MEREAAGRGGSRTGLEREARTVTPSVSDRTGKLATFPLDLIEHDPATQPRAELNVPVVAEYMQAMKEKADFPPVILFDDGQRYWMGDGHHRVYAARSLRLTHIRADVRQGSRRDAILYAVGANVTHGMRRTNEDKRRAVLTLLNDAEWSAWSNREVARRCGVDDHTVAALRPKSSAELPQTPEVRKFERDGKTHEMNVLGINAGRGAPKPDAETQPRSALGLKIVEEEPAEQPEAEEEAERDDTEFVRERIAAAFELVTYYQDYKEVDVAELIDAKRRKALARKAKRLGNWLKNLGQHLERGAP
jgi:hypothetical protein